MICFEGTPEHFHHHRLIVDHLGRESLKSCCPTSAQWLSQAVAIDSVPFRDRSGDNGARSRECIIEGDFHENFLCLIIKGPP